MMQMMRMLLMMIIVMQRNLQINMLLYKVVFILVSTTASIVFSEIEVQKSWSWQPIMTGSLHTGEQTNKNEELLVTAASEYQQQNYTQVDQVVDKLFVAGREGRNVDGFNEVYSDPTIQQALQNGDDTQARNLIKDKLCNLGLMQCEGGTNEGGNDAKRRFLPPDQLIYAQPPPPYRKQAYPPSKGGFNNNNNNNYNHQKVGYISKPIYGGSGPPFDGAIYGSKPPGPIYDGVGPIFEGPVPPGPIYEGSKPSGSFYGGATGGDIPPYKFENVGENVHYESNKKYSQFNQHETQHFSHEHEKPTIVVNAQGGAASTTGGGSAHKDGVNSVNIHHHYHHLDGGDGAGIAGGKGSIVNPILTAGGGAVGGSSSLTSGYASGESNYGHLSGTSLNSIGGTTGYGGSNTGFSSVNSGFSAVNSGFSGVNAGLNGVSGYGSVNGVPGAGGIYGSGVKPVFEEAGAGGTFGTYSAHVPRKQQFNKFQGTTGFGGNQQQLLQQQQLNNFNGGAAASNSLSTGYGGNQYSSYGQLNKYSNSPTTNYFNTGENSNSNNYQEFDIARQGSFGGACVCVPYDRCPAHDIIGRRDDLILPLDPRNLGGKNIEALSDDVPSTNGTNKTNTNNKRDTKDSETQETEKSEVIAKVVDSDSDLATNEKSKITDDKKKITKRDVSEKSTAAVQSEGEARQAPFYQQQQQQGQRFPQQQCGPQQVCCRQPNQQQQQRPGGQCGKRNAQGINGRIKNPVYIDGDSEFGEYPWQAAILKKDAKESVYVCGGTLIDDLHIITAAHCIKSYSPHDLRVRLGEWDVNHDVEFYPYIERDVVNVNIHPEYYAGTLDNDLAVLRLAQPVQYGNAPHISPACLPDKYTDFSGSRCWTTGWGKDAFGDFGKYQNILKEVDVPIINQQQCQQQLRATRLGYNYKLNPGFICAGGEEGKDACKGDGGGPLVCEKSGTWHVVGVVSWGIGCGQVNVPGVYVRVSHYLDWIQQITHRFK